MTAGANSIINSTERDFKELNKAIIEGSNSVEDLRRANHSTLLGHSMPIFTEAEIYSRKFYQEREGLSVEITGAKDWQGTEGLARLVLLQAMAQIDQQNSE